MRTIDKKQIQRIHAILAQAGRANDKEHKANLVGQYSNWRVSSTTGLLYDEAEELINDLQQQARWTPDQVKANDKRRLICHYAHDLNWHLPDGKVNMERIDRWCVQYGRYHKVLNAHDLTELSYLIVQFEEVFKSYLKSV